MTRSIFQKFSLSSIKALFYGAFPFVYVTLAAVVFYNLIGIPLISFFANAPTLTVVVAAIAPIPFYLILAGRRIFLIQRDHKHAALYWVADTPRTKSQARIERIGSAAILGIAAILSLATALHPVFKGGDIDLIGVTPGAIWLCLIYTVGLSRLRLPLTTLLSTPAHASRYTSTIERLTQGFVLSHVRDPQGFWNLDARIIMQNGVPTIEAMFDNPSYNVQTIKVSPELNLVLMVAMTRDGNPYRLFHSSGHFIMTCLDDLTAHEKIDAVNFYQSEVARARDISPQKA